MIGVSRIARIAVCALTLCATSLHAEQLCTTTDLGNKDFNGISGSDDDHVVAVGKDGNISTWNGVSWTSTASPTTEELNDVEMIDAATGFAVGKKGVILYWNGIDWVQHATPTDKELQGVWAASASQAWAGGKNGTLLYYDGMGWADISAAANTSGKDITDVWGDTNSVYALEKDGELYRYDRNLGAWDPADTLCTAGKGFEDLWGDDNGDLYLAGKDEVYRHDGVSCVVVAGASEDLLGIYGGGGHIVAVGKKAIVLEYDGTVWTEVDEGVDDFRDVWVSTVGNAYYVGKKGELTTCECLDCIVPGFVIVHDRYGLHCLDEAIRINVINTVDGNPLASYNSPITLDTQSGAGSWMLASGAGSLDDAVADDGIATYDWPAGETTALFSLRYPQGLTLFDIDAYETLNPGTRDDDTEGLMQYSASGFSVTATATGNPPPALIVPFATPQVAGTDFSVYLTAYGQLPGDPQCGVIETYTGVKNLRFWSAYNDPVTGSVAVTVDGAAISPTEAAAGLQPVTFVNGQAVVTARYKDAGRIRILLKDDGTLHPDLPAGIRGATAAFVSKPARFVLSNIVNGALVNPAAADASGAVFVAAGDPFAVTVTALDAMGDPTPNYGREATAETVALTAVLVAPAGGNNPAIATVNGFGVFAGGQATGSDFSWPETGIVRLLPSVGDGDYLGAGDIVGDSSGNVGRFIPHHFATAVNIPVFDTACDAGGFTYVGEAFTFTIAPQISVTAQAAGGTTTTNYTGSFWKLSNASVANRSYVSATAMLDTSGLPPTALDPQIVDAGGGDGTLLFSAGSGLYFQRGAPVSPFDADIQLSLDVIDADGVTPATNPVVFGAPGGIAFDAGASMRYGRVVVSPALGSERVDLTVPMREEYFIDAATGFVLHSDASCSNTVSVAFSAYTGNLGAGDTCVMDNGTPGASGSGCAASAPASRLYREPPLAGDYNLNLAAPGAGNEGGLTVTATVDSWLRYDWDVATPGEDHPSGRVTFGIYRGDDATVYLREIY